MTSLAEFERFLAREAERLPPEGEARAMKVSAVTGPRRMSLPFGMSIGTAAFAVLLLLFAIPAVWVGLADTPLGGSGPAAPNVSAAGEAQITAEALLAACPNCQDGNHVFVIKDLYQSGSPLSEIVRPMTGSSVQSISALVPSAVFLEADTEEAAAAYEEAGNRRATVITFSPVAYPSEASATVSVGVIWGTNVTETPVEFHWNGSEWTRVVR